MKTKQCNRCKKMKPLSEFGTSGKRKKSVNFHNNEITKYKGDCHECLAAIQKEWRNRNPNYWKKTKSPGYSGKISKYSIEERPILSAIRNRISLAKRNSKRNPEREFNIDADYMYEVWKKQEGMCALTGCKLLIKKGSQLALSMDKIIPKLGYVRGNMQWTCWAANRAKGDMSMNDFVGMCKSVLRTCRDYPERE